MWNFIKRLFGFGKKAASVPAKPTVTTPKPTVTTPKPTVTTPKPTVAPIYTRATVKRSQYYRRHGKFYAYEDDSEIEDLILLALLLDVFSDDIADEETLAELDERTAAEAALDKMDEVSSEEATTSVEEIESAVNEVRETYVAPEPALVHESYSAPEPSYSSSYDSGSSSSSDCGGCD